ncbi:ArsR/SmtB family transcription factor [Ruania zhangjianzhongii]|uniref:ArsR/SmtB family transcription factor n=1 Tax=Ruania zhangjianzhongii TaxID=2603206 RepID=UPI0011C7D731|nr:metalloregulator ArsR/SmtB family transcription factor [Ruania zhangjianzhongii]
MLDHSDTLDRAFHALSDPSRRQMLDQLATGPTSVSELARPLAMTLAAVVQHVQVLESSGLISSHKAGRVRICTIDDAALRGCEQWFIDRRVVWERRLDRLGAVLDEQVTPDEQVSPPPRRSSPRRYEGS